MDFIKNKSIESQISEFVSGQATTTETLGHLLVVKWTALEAVAALVTGVHAAITLLTTTQTITTAITNPVCPRNISIKGTKAGATLTGDVVITGTDIWGQTITDTIALNGDTTVQGVKAFKTVTSLAIPVRVTENDTVSIGWGDKLGIGMYLNAIDQVIQCSHTSAIEATRATVTASATVISLNTIDLNTALDGHIVRAFIAIY